MDRGHCRDCQQNVASDLEAGAREKGHLKKMEILLLDNAKELVGQR